ncbi:alpha-1,3-mannosyl-glycoprotein 4-beta-N-acetylglucosaminyltransferase B [Copidosoma floridanum]|uniref:alpha-1,3-mannosyl-glycoprotein 4-beta-N-acetylglucosaminyltransferase B n=1 Tax=Copidosoma floridanum TaxID=29053 RepID=UPI0006C955D0|nr:alpha-1,3-mannosyl-glycoprotein 4-beta-N-acetylglucosaminyltransferase B [Copidosoma floridanum]
MTTSMTTTTMQVGSHKRWLMILGCLLVPCLVLNYFNSPLDASDELILQNSIAELQVKLDNLHAKYISCQEAIQLLTYQVGHLTDVAHMLPDVQIFLNNSNYNVSNIKLPTAYNFLPHLLGHQNSLRPNLIHSRGRSGISMILGVPHVRREKQNYLLSTLKDLMDNMNPIEIADTLIVVFIAETDNDYITWVSNKIVEQFPNELESGVIEVISPHPSYYPNISKLRDTLGDDHQRVMWRSKQNLDFAFLMSYAQTKGTFYIQLEDDIRAKKNFISTMKSFALQKVSMKQNWLVLDFCELGFIGKLFKSIDLPWLVQFFILFYNDKPVDWLMDHLITTKICALGMDDKRCKQAKAGLWLKYKSSLFQHVGVHSSLKGKVQKLKDKKFGLVQLYYAHRNPEAKVESRITPVKHNTLYKAYKGDTFFWGYSPKSGDYLRFQFIHPVFIKRYLFRSGNAQYPSDKFYDTTVEVLPQAKNYIDKNHSNVTEDGYIITGKFDSFGIANGTVDKTLGKISVLRLTVHSKSANWVILSEIKIEEDLLDNI